jgi:hypothetical protein
MNWDTDILSLGIFLERCGTAVRRLWVELYLVRFSL